LRRKDDWCMWRWPGRWNVWLSLTEKDRWDSQSRRHRGFWGTLLL